MKYKILKEAHKINKLIVNSGTISNEIKESFGNESASIIVKEKRGVHFGSYKAGTIDFQDGFLLDSGEILIDIRVFNSEREVYLWSKGEALRGRSIIIDGQSEECEYFDEKLLLWGDIREINEKYFLLEEEKIKPMMLPIIEGLTKSDNVYVYIRNYLSRNEEDGVPYIKYWRALEISK